MAQPLDLFTKQWLVLSVLAGALGIQVWHVCDVYARTSPYFDGTIPALAISGAVAMELFILIFTANDRKDEPKYFCGLSIALNIVYHFPSIALWHWQETDPMQTAGRLLSSASIPLAVYYCSDLLRSMRLRAAQSETKAATVDFAPVLERIASLHSEHVKDIAGITGILEGLDSLQSEQKTEIAEMGSALERWAGRIASLESGREAELPFACPHCSQRFRSQNGVNAHKCKTLETKSL